MESPKRIIKVDSTCQRAEHVFTRENVRAGVEQSLRRLGTDRLDLVQFHISPSRSVLEQHDSVAELLAVRDEGKLRFVGMSGTLPNLADHIGMGVFDAFQIPYSALEPEHESWITKAAEAGAGIVVRGGVARGIPRARRDALERLPERFRAAFVARLDLWERARLENVLGGMSRMEFMLRYALSHPDMTTTIVGMANPKHLEDNLEAARHGPLPEALYRATRARLAEAAAELGTPSTGNT